MMGTPNRTSAWINFAQRSRDEGGLGLAPHQAAGLVGNLVNESGQDLNPWGPTGDNGTAWGTAQWRGDRLARLKQRPDYQTMEGQMAHMREELDTTENKAYRALLAAKTPEDAAHAWDAFYERSDGSTRDRRMASARALMDQFGGDAGPGALTSSYAPTPSTGKQMPAALSADNTMGPGVLNFGDPNREGGASVIGQGLMGLGASLAGISNPEQAKALVAQQTVLQKAPGNKWTVAHVDPKTGQAILTNGQQFVTQNMFTPKADTVYQDEADKKRAQTDVERYNEMQAAGSKLDESLSKISDFKRAAENPNVKFGGAGGVVAAAKNIAYSLGIPVDGLDDTQTVQRVATQMQLDKGKLLPGSVSNYEDKLMGIANGLGLDKTRESNLTALDQQEAIIKHQKALHAEARKYAAEHNGMLDNGWFDHQAKWMQDNPLTFPEARKAAGAAAPVAIEPGGAYVWTPQGMRKK